MISDMAPSYSGQKDIDHERLMVRYEKFNRSGKLRAAVKSLN
jgi:23S rRNA U2552 (ribose-2'-O)-methylase RlmE/FtsJ